MKTLDPLKTENGKAIREQVATETTSLLPKGYDRPMTDIGTQDAEKQGLDVSIFRS